MPFRPPVVQCTDHRPPVSGAEFCKYYNPNGACSVDLRLMCEEWERYAPENTPPSPAPQGPAAPQAPAAPPARPVEASASPVRPVTLLRPPGTPLEGSQPVQRGFLTSPEPKARPSAKDVGRMTAEALRAPAPHIVTAAGTMLPPRPSAPASDADPLPSEEVLRTFRAGGQSLAARAVEVTFDGAAEGGLDVALVASPTGRTDRVEISYEEAAYVRWASELFGGAKVTFHPKKRGKDEGE